MIEKNIMDLHLHELMVVRRPTFIPLSPGRADFFMTDRFSFEAIMAAGSKYMVLRPAQAQNKQKTK